MFNILDEFEMVLDEMDGRVMDRWSRQLGTQTRLLENQPGELYVLS